MTRANRFRILATLALSFMAMIAGAAQTSRHFVVVLAASQVPDFDPVGLGVFQRAESHVYDLLFKPGMVVAGQPWYRIGHDVVTIIESGPGTKPKEAKLIAQGNWKAIAYDYARPITRPAIKIRPGRFGQIFHPAHRVHQYDAYLALAASRSQWMSPSNTNEFHLIVLREVDRDSPKTPAEVSRHFEALARDYVVSGKKQTSFVYTDDLKFIVETADLDRTTTSGSLSSATKAGSSNLIQRGSFRTVWKILELFAALALVAWVGRWVWYERQKARHFEFWIPGFATAFTLPPIAESIEANFRARLPRYCGEPAAHLQLPSRSIRLLFYSRAKLRWDPRLQVDGLDPSISAYPVRRLRRFVRFLWVERPTDEGNLDISIERPRMLGGNDQIVISVNFLALPKSDPEP